MKEAEERLKGMKEDEATIGVTIEQCKEDTEEGTEIRRWIIETTEATLEGRAEDIARYGVCLLGKWKANRYLTEMRPIEISGAIQRAASTIIAKRINEAIGESETTIQRAVRK